MQASEMDGVSLPQILPLKWGNRDDFGLQLRQRLPETGEVRLTGQEGQVGVPAKLGRAV